MNSINFVSYVIFVYTVIFDLYYSGTQLIWPPKDQKSPAALMGWPH